MNSAIKMILGILISGIIGAALAAICAILINKKDDYEEQYDIDYGMSFENNEET